MMNKKNTKVEIYRNLNNNKWSIRCSKSNLVLAHATQALLYDAEFVVNEKDRQKVINEKRKNVHAFVRGYLVNWIGQTYKDRFVGHPIYSNHFPSDCDLSNWSEITYNPYCAGYFFDVMTNKPTYNSEYVYFTDSMVCKSNHLSVDL